jgi:hypothetical protein
MFSNEASSKPSSRRCSQSSLGKLQKHGKIRRFQPVQSRRWKSYKSLISSVWAMRRDSAANSCCNVLRCAFNVRTKAGIDCKPTKASLASAALCAGNLEMRRLRSSPYTANRRQRSSSGALSGNSEIGIASTLRSGNDSPRRLKSAFSRRTITGSRSFGRTTTPRVNRCGSSISRSAEKLLEWPLCGVAVRNRRCSKRSESSRCSR